MESIRGKYKSPSLLTRAFVVSSVKANCHAVFVPVIVRETLKSTLSCRLVINDSGDAVFNQASIARGRGERHSPWGVPLGLH